MWLPELLFLESVKFIQLFGKWRQPPAAARESQRGGPFQGRPIPLPLLWLLFILYGEVQAATIDFPS